MGWDVVEIGLRHDLPIGDPIAAAVMLAERLDANVSVIAECDIEFDENGGKAFARPACDIAHELKCVRVNDSDERYYLQIPYDKAQEVIDTVGLGTQKGNRKVDMVAERIFRICKEAVYQLTNKENDIDIDVYRENVDLGADISLRWNFLEMALKDLEKKDVLADLRKQIQERAKVFGCGKVIICADQGPGEFIYGKATASADELLRYIGEYEYIEDYEKNEEPSGWSWKDGARHIEYSSYFDGTLVLRKDEHIDVVFDEV